MQAHMQRCAMPNSHAEVRNAKLPSFAFLSRHGSEAFFKASCLCKPMANAVTGTPLGMAL
eukprot:4358984-Lingulodinium_polyedra.AAC.1